MQAEKTIALSVRIAPETKTYLYAMAAKKGVGVARVLDQIIAEQEDTPEEIYYLKFTAHFSLLSTFMMHRLFIATGQAEKDQANHQIFHQMATHLFGPMPSAPKRFEKLDPANVPPVFKELYDALDRLIPAAKPESPSAHSEAPSSGETGQC